jgi:xylono-1,5-lactonase
MTETCRVISDIRCELGEGPLWSERHNALYWVDILSAKLYRLSLGSGDVADWSLPEMTGWVVERRDKPGFIAGLKSGFHELTLNPFECRAVVDPEPEQPGNRMNDAKVDHLGRIWAGTMDAHIRKATGSLYRLDPDFTVSRQDTGYLVTNGPAFDPAGEIVYHNDTGRGIVYRFRMSPSGELENKEEFIRVPEEAGRPDGMTVDAEGHLWIAHWGGGRVTRYTPEGKPERAIELPASQITSVTFGGSDLDRLFVTSAAKDKHHEPRAGMLFEVDPGTRGLPPNYFAG